MVRILKYVKDVSLVFNHYVCLCRRESAQGSQIPTLWQLPPRIKPWRQLFIIVFYKFGSNYYNLFWIILTERKGKKMQNKLVLSCMVVAGVATVVCAVLQLVA